MVQFIFNKLGRYYLKKANQKVLTKLKSKILIHTNQQTKNSALVYPNGYTSFG